MTVHLSLHVAGSCLHPEHVILQTGSLRPMTFPAMFAVIRHPKEGVTLFDTGYGEAFFKATDPFPERLYRWVTPVTFDAATSAKAILAREGIQPHDVRRIVISHFHADHIAALGDFPAAEFLYAPSALDALLRQSRVSALLSGFLPALLPSDFSERALPLSGELVPLPPSMAPFEAGVDVLGDRSVIAVPLPGHARGQLGLYIDSEDPTFLVADACWVSQSFRERRLPHPITRLIMDDHRRYADTLDRLHTLDARQSAVRIVPSHCEETLSNYGALNDRGPRRGEPKEDEPKEGGLG